MTCSTPHNKPCTRLSQAWSAALQGTGGTQALEIYASLYKLLSIRTRHKCLGLEIKDSPFAGGCEGLKGLQDWRRHQSGSKLPEQLQGWNDLSLMWSNKAFGQPFREAGGDGLTCRSPGFSLPWALAGFIVAASFCRITGIKWPTRGRVSFEAERTSSLMASKAWVCSRSRSNCWDVSTGLFACTRVPGSDPCHPVRLTQNLRCLKITIHLVYLSKSLLPEL